MTHSLLETPRLLIRSFLPTDTPTIHRILNETFGEATDVEQSDSLAERQAWVEWSALNHEWFPKMHQAPYGDRAIVLKSSGALIGSVGYVAQVMPDDWMAGLENSAVLSEYFVPEFAMFWVIDPSYQRQGYAAEAVQAMIEYAFQKLRLKQILAVTEHTNLASQGVMKKVGMKLLRNTQPDPFWLQVVGVLKNQ